MMTKLNKEDHHNHLGFRSHILNMVIPDQIGTMIPQHRLHQSVDHSTTRWEDYTLFKYLLSHIVQN